MNISKLMYTVSIRTERGSKVNVEQIENGSKTERTKEQTVYWEH